MDKYISDFMAATIEIALSNPIAPFGAIIVYDDKDILLKSINSADNNPLMHGELSVIHMLFEKGFNRDVSKLSLYTTAEPCPNPSPTAYPTTTANLPSTYTKGISSRFHGGIFHS